jgi:type II secretory pathway pseudopilin PulG
MPFFDGLRRVGSRLASSQSGFALVELIVGSVVIVIVAGGAVVAIDSSYRTSAQERARAHAHAVAQADQSRLRGMQISDLANLHETRTVNVEGDPYTVDSAGEFVTDATGTASCEQGTASPDYLRITSRVTWNGMGDRPPVRLQSVVAPPNGSVSADRGALAIAVRGGQGQGIEGVQLTGTGAGSFSGPTAENGCAIFGNLPAGNYTLTPSAPMTLVDQDGEPPAPQTISVVALSTNTIALQYDEPGGVRVDFTVRNRTGQIEPALADSVVVFNTGMTDADAFGELGTPAGSITAEPLFPFASPDSVYAGSCSGNNPNPDGDAESPAAPAISDVQIQPGLLATATVQLPALYLDVLSGTSAADPGTPVSDARVVIQDRNCAIGGQPVTREQLTTATGELPNPALPWGDYDLCVEAGGKAASVGPVAVKDLEAGTSEAVYLGAAPNGSC